MYRQLGDFSLGRGPVGGSVTWGSAYEIGKKSSVQGLNFVPQLALVLQLTLSPTCTSPSWHYPNWPFPQLALFWKFFCAIQNLTLRTAGTPSCTVDANIAVFGQKFFVKRLDKLVFSWWYKEAIVDRKIAMAHPQPMSWVFVLPCLNLLK